MSSIMHVVCPACSAVNRVDGARIEYGPNCGKCKENLFPTVPLELSAKQTRAQIDKGSLPVVVDFWAPWCGPCKMMGPAVKEAARLLGTRVRFLKVDTEQEQGMAAEYGIRSVPTLILLAGGREINRISGAMSAQDLVQWVRSSLS
jgi:thioredoxin 2